MYVLPQALFGWNEMVFSFEVLEALKKNKT